MDKPRVYIETSVVSYLTARPSKNLLVAAWQSATVEWWESRRSLFGVFASNVVVSEVSQGDPEAALRRLRVVDELHILELDERVRALVKRLMAERALPPKAADDAFHVAISAVNGMDFLLTWNCRHIANAEMKPVIRSVCLAAGYGCPEICTPQELMGVDYDAGRSDF